MPTEHFKSKEAYRKNMAYRHIHGIPFTAKNVVVGGNEHAVKHSTNAEREKIDTAQRQKTEMAQFKGESHSYSNKRPKRKVLSRYQR
jgi:hypothetical protein